MTNLEFLKDYVYLALAYPTDDCLLWPFAVDSQGYGIVNVGLRPNRTKASVSRLAFVFAFPHVNLTNQEVGHSSKCVTRGRDGKRCINPKHLTPLTRSENQGQRTLDQTSDRFLGPKQNNTSGFKGVSLKKGLWCARIRINGRKKDLGLYKTKEDAARAYDRAVLKYWGEGYLNFPEEK